MSLAFDGVSNVFFDAGLLSEKLLEQDIPLFVCEAAIAGGWWTFASETRQAMFPTNLGRYWVWLDESRNWNLLFAGEAAAWKAQLLDPPIRASDPAAQSGTTARGFSEPVARRRVARMSRHPIPGLTENR